MFTIICTSPPNLQGERVVETCTHAKQILQEVVEVYRGDGFILDENNTVVYAVNGSARIQYPELVYAMYELYTTQKGVA